LNKETAWYQVGVATFRLCSEEGQPSFFTDVSQFSSWINSGKFNSLQSPESGNLINQIDCQNKV